MNFDSGVSNFICGTATVTNYFPMDAKGNADVSCAQCRFYRDSARRCALNDELCNYPTKYIGANCPMQFTQTTY